MIITGENYSRRTDIIGNDVAFVDCNFSQELPHTKIIGLTGCTFERCNLVNCQLDESNVFIDCNTSQVDLSEDLNG
jgi:uncharacterized protein YjbI with pentapeptide repeats